MMVIMKFGVQITIENMNKPEKAAFTIDDKRSDQVFLKLMEKPEVFMIHREILEKREWMIYREADI